MRNIFEEAALLQQFLDSSGIPFCFIGGLALQRWGELRTTNDIDLTIYTGFTRAEDVVDLLLRRYPSRIPTARETALTAHVLLLSSPEGIGIDIALGGLPFERLSIERASEAEYLPGIFLKTCSAEDLVVHKAFAARPKDWLDIEGILLRQPPLDWLYIETQLKPLLELKEEPEHWGTLCALHRRVKGG